MAESAIAVASQESDIVPGTDMQRASKELYTLQADIAMYMEVAYLSATNFPELAGEIRLSAHSARTLHTMTVGLVKKHQGAADHVIETIIPLILQGVELKDRDIIRTLLQRIIDLASDMKTEAENTQKSYHELQKGVNNNINSVMVTQGKEKEATKKRKDEQESFNDKQNQLKQEMQQIDDEMKQSKEKIQERKAKVKEGKKSKDAAVKDHTDQVADALVKTVTLPISMIEGILPGFTKLNGGEIGDGASEIIYAVMKPTKDSIVAAAKLYKSSKQITVEQEKLKEEFEKKRKEQERLRHIEEELKRTRKEEHETLRKLRSLTLEETESVSNINCLRKTYNTLGSVDKQLGKIAVFWQDIVVEVCRISNKTKAADAFVQKIKKPKHASIFVQTICDASKNWKRFQACCGGYVAVVERSPRFSVGVLYGFMSIPIDDMSTQAKKDRKIALFDTLESNLPAITCSDDRDEISDEN